MLNRIVLVGRLTKDPELRYLPNGTATTTFTLAVDRPFSKDGEKEADFIGCVVWRQLAELVSNYCKKGKMVALEGRLQVRNYTNNEGKKVWVHEVVADNVRFLPDGKDNSKPADPFAGDSKPIDFDPDDLPFP